MNLLDAAFNGHRGQCLIPGESILCNSRHLIILLLISDFLGNDDAGGAFFHALHFDHALFRHMIHDALDGKPFNRFLFLFFLTFAFTFSFTVGISAFDGFCIVIGKGVCIIRQADTKREGRQCHNEHKYK